MLNLINILTLTLVNIKQKEKCPKIQLQNNPKINLTEYIRATWYVQQQQLNGYQSLDDLYCVLATYNIDNYSHVPFFDGKVISVYNYANKNKVNGNSMPNNNSINNVLCARQKNQSTPEKLSVAPCFLPNIFSGPYWILSAGPYTYNYKWAVVVGGQPTLRINNNTCTTKTYGINNSGLWIFSREKILNNNTLEYIRKLMNEKGISTSKLYNVTQKGCNYINAYIKN